jgi:hypothetical protein
MTQRKYYRGKSRPHCSIKYSRGRGSGAHLGSVAHHHDGAVAQYGQPRGRLLPPHSLQYVTENRYKNRYEMGCTLAQSGTGSAVWTEQFYKTISFLDAADRVWL